MRKILILITVLFVSNFYAQDILPLKERADFINKLQKERFNNLLPELMDKTGIDMWVLIAREYNEDPIIKTISFKTHSVKLSDHKPISVTIEWP